jgi:carbamoyltransferase
MPADAITTIGLGIWQVSDQEPPIDLSRPITEQRRWTRFSYMLLVADVAKQHRREMSPEEQALFGIDKLNVPRSAIPAVTHVDYSARIQTVHQDTNPRYHALLSRFKARTGCPNIVNTSFNVRGEPIVGTPEDAFRCFMGTEIEVLAIGNCYLRKEEQDPSLRHDYKSAFEPD